MSDWFNAVETGDLAKVTKLLSENPNLLHSRSDDGETAIIKASRYGHTAVVKFLLENGANPNDADTTSAGQTPLIHAVFNGNIEIVKLLLDARANIEKKNNTPGEGPLINAIQEGKIEVAELLLKRGADADVKNTEDETTLTLATIFCRGGDREKMCALLKQYGKDKSSHGGKKTKKRRKRSKRSRRRRTCSR